MTHCTVCGAAAREGAKFCTSCGARLVDTTYSAPAETAAAADETAVSSAIPVDTAERDQSAVEPESTWASPEPTAEPAGETVMQTETEPASEKPAQPVANETPEPAPAQPEYATSWPADETADAEPAGEAGTAPEPSPSWNAWSSEEAATASGPAPASFATDADQDPEAQGWPDDTSTAPSKEAPSPFATDADQDARAEATPDTDTGDTASAAEAPPADVVDEMEASHHGASEWESWAPVASGESTVVHHDTPSGESHAATASDLAASVRRLLDDLANRIDRMIAPVTLESRDVDADALADQIERWSRPAQGSTDLLEVVQAVRKAPRDIDAIGELAGRAADLELLVRHYQAITAGAGEWARELRAQQAPGGDEA